MRLYGYANNSTPHAFSYVLMVYLLGIALGAQAGKRICRDGDRSKMRSIAVLMLGVASALAVGAPWLYFYSLRYALEAPVVFLCIFMTAASLSVLFPITHHLGTLGDNESGSRRGRHFSRVYMLNVAGAALGPIITGYILLEYFGLTQVFPLLGSFLAAVAVIAFFMFGGVERKFLLGSFAALAVSMSCLTYINTFSPHALVELLGVVKGPIVAVNESRHGVIAISRAKFVDGEMDDIVYGGNVYDGKTNVDLVRNSNGLERPLALHVLQPNAKRVLILGLSIGSWLTVVEGFPGIEIIDVVEINPGYIELAQSYAPQMRALKDPRVSLVVDDARRWLRFNPEKKYDLILMNTTWHWRANSSMLLSLEMMQLVERHMSEGAVLAFNATGSVDSFYTASMVFKETRRYQNFIYGANWNAFDKAGSAEAWEVLNYVTVDGVPGFAKDRSKIEAFSKVPFIDIASDLARMDRPPEVITDDNMLVEYKYGQN